MQRGAFGEYVPYDLCYCCGWKEVVASIKARLGQLFVWNVYFRRNVQDWELDQLVDLLGVLYGVKDGGWSGLFGVGLFEI